jgi:hypothetical protein
MKPRKNEPRSEAESMPSHGIKNRRDQDYEQLIDGAPPCFKAFHVEETKLVFANNQISADPKEGLTLFGPANVGGNSSRTIRVAAISTGEGINTLKAYLETARQRIRPGLNSRKKPYDPICFPDFPGANSAASFRVDFVTEPAIQRIIPEDFFQNAVQSPNVSTKLKQVVDLIVAKLKTLADSDPEPDVVVIVLPPCVEKECATVGAAFRGQKVILTPVQKMIKRFEKQRLVSGQDFLGLEYSDPAAAVQGSGYWNLHHALKAHAMSCGLTTQIAWETTLRGDGLTQDPASAAWNFFTALYYKSNHIPWQLAAVPQNTCFVGVTFYKESPLEGADMQSSLAQVFSGHGEGLVLKGEKALVDKKRDRKPHLTEPGAQQLLSRALALYQQMHGVKPARVVIHKTSRFWKEELDGFRKALGDIPSHDFLALDRLGVRFMRVGQKPPLRGTAITLAPRKHIIYTTGYVPQLGDFPGMRVPIPLQIVEHHGESTVETLAREILALTKVNWNSCAFCNGDPITIQFARSVGHILTELPKGVEPQTKYKFYM